MAGGTKYLTHFMAPVNVGNPVWQVELSSLHILWLLNQCRQSSVNAGGTKYLTHFMAPVNVGNPVWLVELSTLHILCSSQCRQSSVAGGTK